MCQASESSEEAKVAAAAAAAAAAYPTPLTSSPTKPGKIHTDTYFVLLTPVTPPDRLIQDRGDDVEGSMLPTLGPRPPRVILTPESSLAEAKTRRRESLSVIGEADATPTPAPTKYPTSKLVLEDVPDPRYLRRLGKRKGMLFPAGRDDTRAKPAHCATCLRVNPLLVPELRLQCPECGPQDQARDGREATATQDGRAACARK